MTVPSTDNVDVTVRVATEGGPTVRDRSSPEHVVSVLFGTDLEEWRRGWQSAAAGEPRRETIIVASDHSRSAVAGTSTGVVPNRGLAYSVLGPNPDGDRVLTAVSEALSEFPGEAPTVLIDDLEPFAARIGAMAAGKVAARIADVTTGLGGSLSIGCSLTPETVSSLVPLGDVADRVLGTDPEAIAAVERLHQTDPTTFGYTRRYWAEAQRGIEACSRNYPQSKQVHAALSEPDTTPRTLGATLSGLVSLDVLDVWGETVGPTRYDLTVYDRARLAAIGSAFTAIVDEDRDGG